jgi:hypothetical protein
MIEGLPSTMRLRGAARPASGVRVVEVGASECARASCFAGHAASIIATDMRPRYVSLDTISFDTLRPPWSTPPSCSAEHDVKRPVRKKNASGRNHPRGVSVGRLKAPKQETRVALATTHITLSAKRAAAAIQQASLRGQIDASRQSGRGSRERCLRVALDTAAPPRAGCRAPASAR